MFTLQWFYQLHFYIIAAGLLALMASLYIIRFKKDKPWRIKKHRILAVLGVIMILMGVLTMYLGKQSVGLNHFTVPHAFGGLITIILLITTPILAIIGMKGNKKVLKMHRLFGRLTAIFVVLVAIVGFTILLSYI
jgi:heme A synthase